MLVLVGLTKEENEALMENCGGPSDCLTLSISLPKDSQQFCLCDLSMTSMASPYEILQHWKGSMSASTHCLQHAAYLSAIDSMICVKRSPKHNTLNLPVSFVSPFGLAFKSTIWRSWGKSGKMTVNEYLTVMKMLATHCLQCRGPDCRVIMCNPSRFGKLGEVGNSAMLSEQWGAQGTHAVKMFIDTLHEIKRG